MEIFQLGPARIGIDQAGHERKKPGIEQQSYNESDCIIPKLI